MAKTKKIDENGFASIVIALILIIVLALLTVGFAQLSRREQQTALNKQLANQAYYAAESGINDAYKDILNGQINIANASPTACMHPTAGLTQNQTVNASTGVYYTCLLVNLTPQDIKYDNIATESNRYITFSAVDPTTHGPVTLSSLRFQWGSADGQNTFQNGSDVGNFEPVGTNAGQWGSSPAVLEVSITPLSSFSRAQFSGGAFTVYLYPASSGANSVAYDTTKQGPVISGNCAGSGAYPCSATITGLPGTPGESYLVRIIDHYDNSNVDFTGSNGGGAIDFANGQAQIDVTGKAQDILKRLQVRVPIGPAYDLPRYALEGQDACKRFTTDPASGTQFNPSPSVTDPDSACQP